MKKIIFILFSFFIFYSCSSDDTNIDGSTLLGTWKLSEINNDPGDGSGTMHAVESEKTLVFNKNIVSSNGDVYNNTINSDSPSSGTYMFIKGSSVSGVILPLEDGVLASSIGIQFEISEKILYVYYPCIEGCSAKYIKTK